MTERITVTPSTATPPCWVLVCYEVGIAVLPLVLRIDFEPSTIEDLYEDITEGMVGENGKACVPVYLPTGTTGVLIIDESGQSEDASVLISA